MAKKLDILYLDDEPHNLTVFELLFASDHNVHTFVCGSEAVKFLEEKSPKLDVIISDFLMPKMNGIDFKKGLAPAYQNVPFVILSGFVEDLQLREAASSGLIEAYFEKPIDQDDLLIFFAKL